MKLGSPSEKRLIKDINPLESSLDEALELQGLSYHWKTEQYPDGGFENARQISLVTQDVEAVIPGLVSKVVWTMQ